MSTSLFFALFALLAFGFVFKAVSPEERRNFFRTLVAMLMTVGLVSYFVHPLMKNAELKHLLDLTAIVAFVLSVLFLLAYIKLDQKVRLERGELHPLDEKNCGGKKGGRR
jgi:DMSO/TMAO reductase YedYZ heme-binding membrane subunit